MKQVLLTLCILSLLGGWNQLHAHQSCIRQISPEVSSGQWNHESFAGEDETVALHDGYPSSDPAKQIVKMAPTEVTEEEEDDHELVSFECFAAFVFAQTFHNVKERLQFCHHLTHVSSSRLHLLIEVFRI